MDKFNLNKMLNEQEIAQGKLVLESFARRLVVTLSSLCNINCIMCEVRRTQWDIPQETLQEVSELLPYAESVIWQGGEPFLLDYFEEIFDKARTFPCLRQTIVTNGLLITEQWAEKLAGNNVELVFSVDGVTSDVFERIRVGARFSDVIRSIRLVNEARRRACDKSMSLRLHVVIMRSNYRQLVEFVDFAKEYGFDAIHFISIWGNNDSPENIFYRRDQEALGFLTANIVKAKELARRYKIQLLNSLPILADGDEDEKIDRSELGTEDKLFCQLPWQQINIDPGGGMRPGCLCLKTIGNILENSLKDLWNNVEMQSYREKILNDDYGSWCNPACLSGQISKELRGH
jgi:MoaA/NifB/PqqE/SkfB family radical SAM enzyme